MKAEKSKPNQKRDWHNLDDDILIKAFIKGDSTAFEVLFEKYRDQVSRLVFSILKLDTHVDDVVQEVFLLVYRHLPKFRFQSAFKTWLYRITVNETLRQIAKNKRWQPLNDQEGDNKPNAPKLVVVANGESPERMYLAGESKSLVQNALKEMKPNHKLILTLYYLEDLPVQEIAEILEIPEGSVKSRLFYAREGLRKAMDQVITPKQTPESRKTHVL